MAFSQTVIHDFSLLGKVFHEVSVDDSKDISYTGLSEFLREYIEKAYLYNSWFLTDFIKSAFSAWSKALQKEKIKHWIRGYETNMLIAPGSQTIGVIMAGNIPMVGLHDLLCILASGNKALIKLSSSDDILIPAVLEVLCKINPFYSDRFSFTEGPLKKFDAIIATGSNNSSRYFDYYFGKYPHIIRKNRNSAAVLTGDEKEEELVKLADDMLMFFGLGCRSVSKLYLPYNYDFERLTKPFSYYSYFFDHHKYRNNYDYQKSILLINNIPHFDNGFILFKEDMSLISPISVIHYEYYKAPADLNIQMEELKENLQCLVAADNRINSVIPFGTSQFPELWDYADGIDTMEFLTKMRKNQ